MSEGGPNMPPLGPLDYASPNRQYQAYGSPIPSFILGIIGGILGSIALVLLLIFVLGSGGITFLIASGLALSGLVYLVVKTKRRGAFIAGSICGFFLLVLLAGGVCFAAFANAKI